MRSSGARVVCTTAAGLFAVAAITLSWRPHIHDAWLYVPLRLFGIVAIGMGFLAWRRPSWAAVGPLLVAAGAAYYLQDLRASENDVVFAVGFCLAFLWTAVVAHLVLVWPSGRPPSRPVRRLIVLCYVAAIGSQVVRYTTDRPSGPLWISSGYDHTPAAKAGSILVTVLALVVVAVVVRRWLTANRLRRRPAAPVWAAVVVAGLVGTLTSLASLFEAQLPVERGLLLAALAISVLLVPAVVLARSALLMRLRWRLTALVLERDRDLDLESDPERLQRELADVLGDPTIRLAYPLDDGYVDVYGRPFHPRPDGERTVIHRQGQVLALLEHDQALHQERNIARTTASVVGVALESARRYALLRAQVEQIRTSRLRLATAAFEERHRIQRDLHDGAQQQLFAVLVLLDLAQRTPEGTRMADLVGRAHRQLGDAIAALRELTQGIYPAALTEHGLAAAVEALADVAPIPVSFTVPNVRWPSHVEAALYFTIAEALANCYKHAEADHVRIAVHEQDGTVCAEIVDAGRGGADETGSGLRGLQDRVVTVGGTLSISTEPGRGSQIVAVIPLEQA